MEKQINFISPKMFFLGHSVIVAEESHSEVDSCIFLLTSGLKKKPTSKQEKHKTLYTNSTINLSWRIRNKLPFKNIRSKR